MSQKHMWRPANKSQKSLLSFYHVEGTQVIVLGGKCLYPLCAILPGQDAKFYVINNKRNICYHVVICSIYEASHPALSEEPVRNTEGQRSILGLWNQDLMLSLNKAPGRLYTCCERSLICTGRLDGAAIVTGWASERLSSPPWVDLSPGQWQVGGSLCCLILGLETKGRWYPFRNTQGETESPSFGHFFFNWEGSEKILSAFWNLEDT